MLDHCGLLLVLSRLWGFGRLWFFFDDLGRRNRLVPSLVLQLIVQHAEPSELLHENALKIHYRLEIRFQTGKCRARCEVFKSNILIAGYFIGLR